MKRVLPRGSVMERSNPHLVNGIPTCPDCKSKAVRWRNKWVCRQCYGLWDAKKSKEVPIVSVFLNRAARRASR